MNTTTANNLNNPSIDYHVMEEDHPHNTVNLGFWIYLMSDCFIFGCLFACYAVYAFGGHFANGPKPADALELTGVAICTASLLLSSLTYGFGMIELQRQRKGAVLFWLIVAGLFAAIFLGTEIHEFITMIDAGHGPGTSAFLSSFFTLVGTHGLHVTMGLIWLVTLIVQLLIKGTSPDMTRRLTCLGMYWHFLDLVWVGIFSFVYLVGVIA